MAQTNQTFRVKATGEPFELDIHSTLAAQQDLRNEMAEHHNSFVSQKSSDSGLQAYIHPLVLLNISDHITRHAVRQQHGPIVGALLGQHKGRTISLEHVFECTTVVEPNGDVFLHQAWFSERLQQFKDVHKSPALDLVGWFTITPLAGPTLAQLPLHRQLLEHYNEAAVLLAFHASELESPSSTGKLPITIYESVYEEDNVEDVERSMDIDGQPQTRQLHLRFRELPYSIETGEAEMISVDFVATGGGNAAAVGSSETPRLVPKHVPDHAFLSREDEDLIASLTTRLGAVRILESRLHLIKAYLSSQIPSTAPTDASTSPSLSHSILRSIYSLIFHLALLTPQGSNALSVESLAQANDVALVALLASMGGSVQALRELGKKFSIECTVRQDNGTRDPHASTQSRLRDEMMLRGRSMKGDTIWG
ncbi:hypothetical protein LOZ53_004507 [Ophidiomyces ophidiicola]|nr:hypothetical protein LOZ55_002305 [Ophidiomyces ophidiicola]KAI1986934.1 hypothetical protein LOZ53_004507 [Ophidiomyces ophidiicola]KAI1987421.1 hypothetical protein LOZ54_003593 [Ophidiomyces ophidiicola]KAI2001199.1 hypothetical protein LOZ51_001491 [Ophidiomyces ophidiicola]